MTFRSAFRAQVCRDLAEWWPLWAASVAAGLVPLLLPVIYSADGEEAMDLRLAAVAVGGGLFWLASVGLLGDGLASRDLGEGRYGFFASRPVGAGAFWLARVAAALVLLIAITASLALPTWMAHPPDLGAREPALSLWTMPLTAPGVDLTSPWAPNYGGEGVVRILSTLAPAGVAGGLLSLLLVAHLAGTVGRSRDAWTLLDLGGVVLLIVLLVQAREILVSAQAFAVLVAAERFFAAMSAAILLLAGWRQVAHGRVDLARGHGAFSRFAWPALALVAVALLGAASWVAHPAPQDLRSAERVRATPDGGAALVTGSMSHRLGLRSGVVFSEAEAVEVTGPVHAVAAADQAERLAWTRCRRFRALDCEVWTWASGLNEASATGIFSHRWDHHLAWSPHGEMLALAHDRVEVWQPAVAPAGTETTTSGPRLIYARDLEERYPQQPGFLSARRLRYLTVDPDSDFMRVEEIDLSSRAVRTLGDLPGEAPLQVVTSPSGRHVAATSMIPSRTSILDVQSGRVYELQEHPLVTGGFLAALRFADHRSFFLLMAGPDAVVDGNPVDADWRLVRVDLELLAGDETDAALTEIPLPAIGQRAVLGAHGGTLLLSAEIGHGVGAASTSRLALPAGVEPAAGYALWELDLDGLANGAWQPPAGSSDGAWQPPDGSSDGAWHRLAGGVRLLYEPIRLAPQTDDAILIAGDGTVLRLSDAGLEIVVPALPETKPGRPRRF